MSSAAAPSPMSSAAAPSPMPVPAPDDGAGPHPAATVRPKAHKAQSSTKPKRKRPLMNKGDRQNTKFWATGARENIMRPHLEPYAAELTKGPQFAHAYAVKVCHEFNYKIPYDLEDKYEPESIPEYDPKNPPPLPKLSKKKEAERSKKLEVRDKRVVRWLYHRARQIISPGKSVGGRDNNIYTAYIKDKLGLSAPKKARQGWQQFQHENPELVQESAQRAWEQHRAELGSDEEDDNGSDSDNESGDDESDDDDDESDDDDWEDEDEDEGAGEGEGEGEGEGNANGGRKSAGTGTGKAKGKGGARSKSKVKAKAKAKSKAKGKGKGKAKKKARKTVGFISEHARQLFRALPEHERKAILDRAKAAKAEEVARWKAAKSKKPSKDPQAVQHARDHISSILEPIMNGISRFCGGAHVLVLVGGREPQNGGRIKADHYVVGRNQQRLYFHQWQPDRFQKDFLGFYTEFLETVWSEEDCARMSLDDTPQIELQNAPYRIDATPGPSFATSDKLATLSSDSDSDDDAHLEGDESRPKKRARTDEDNLSPPHQQMPFDNPPAHNEDGQRMNNGAYEPLEIPPPLPTRPKPTPVRRNPARASASNQSRIDPPTENSPPTLQSAPPMPTTTSYPIDPVLLRPPYVSSQPPPASPPQPIVSPAAIPAPMLDGELPRQAAQTATVGSSPPPASSASSPAEPSSRTSLPAPHDAPANAAPMSVTARSSSSRPPAVLPAVPDNAPSWFSMALGRMRIDLGEDWARLLTVWAMYEQSTSYGTSLPARNARLDAAGCRPKEVSAWIANGRWRSSGCEPSKKGGRFAFSFMNAWWAWYIKLSPEWREETEDGRLEEFSDFGEDAPKLNIPGNNGVLSLVIGLKWVGEALLLENGVYNQTTVSSDWRRGIVDLTRMLEGLIERRTV